MNIGFPRLHEQTVSQFYYYYFFIDAGIIVASNNVTVSHALNVHLPPLLFPYFQLRPRSLHFILFLQQKRLGTASPNVARTIHLSSGTLARNTSRYFTHYFFISHTQPLWLSNRCNVITKMLLCRKTIMKKRAVHSKRAEHHLPDPLIHRMRMSLGLVPWDHLRHTETGWIPRRSHMLH